MEEQNTARQQILPLQIQREDTRGVVIRWSDGLQQELSSELLRRECPCAECKELRGDLSHSKPLSPKPSLLRVVDHTVEEAFKLEAIWAVGNYALGARWGDSHATGIYTFPYLRSLSDTLSKDPAE